MPRWSAESYTRPCDGEYICGDSAMVIPLEEGLLLAVVDGLGHGPAARAVSAVAEDWLRENAGLEVASVTNRLCERLRKTDGAAVGLCFLDHVTGRATYAGIGSTVLRFVGQHHEGHLVSRDGIAGRTSITAKPYSAQLHLGDLLLLYSDGVRSHFPIEECLGLETRDLAAVARSVVLRFGKSHDDATCIAARWERESHSTGGS